MNIVLIPVNSFGPPSRNRASRCRYQGGRTFDDFLKFLEEQLEADKGFARHPALDMLATTWLSTAPGPAQEGLITKARTQQPKLHVTAAVEMIHAPFSRTPRRRGKPGTGQLPGRGFDQALVREPQTITTEKRAGGSCSQPIFACKIASCVAV